MNTNGVLGDYVRVGEAAAFLGISAKTLRNWDGSGKLKAIRHPMNGYRLYKKTDLEQLMRDLEASLSSSRTTQINGSPVAVVTGTNGSGAAN